MLDTKKVSNISVEWLLDRCYLRGRAIFSTDTHYSLENVKYTATN